ncbi:MULTISPECIES: glycosyltransferase family 9 protein [Providencia]|nr:MULTISPECIES: hypothetical protein [Providencia]ELR5059120.1 glycosyltransferase family 9 protein [Providencia rettgeri]ELR5088564.1 glycosyltransferase family 9 protein [Providencia rettgeri]ELY3858031.1 glycosyltransferase family 9 protein [Providencia rettgeri]ELY3858601.1 glycosyltransferase family 9 protein [Providencia rettgeri]MDH2324736.1 hypothetical protein [Providencia rettgeri]
MSFNEFKYKFKSTIQQIKMLKPADAKDNKIKNIDSVCIVLVNVGIGDAIMATSFIHTLKKMNKIVDIVLAKKNVDIFSENLDIRNCFLVGDANICKIKYDLVVDPYSHCGWFFSYKYYSLLNKMNYIYLSGFNVKAPKKYSDNFIASDGIHITDYYNHILKKFFNNTVSGQYIVNIPTNEQEKAKQLLENTPVSSLKIAFCPFASTQERSFSDEQVNRILSELNKIKDISIIILCEEYRMKHINLTGNSYFYKTRSFLSSAAILSLCDFCVSSDTSFVHLANSKDIPLLAFYSSVYNDGFNTDFLCAPNYKKSKQIIEPTGIKNIKVDDIVNAIIAEIKQYYRIDGGNNSCKREI